MKKTNLVMSFLVASMTVTALAKVDVRCESKRDQVIKSVCGKSSSDDKRKECVAFYKSAACGTVALHVEADSQ